MNEDIGSRELLAFSTLARMNSYTLASSALGMTQSSLSKKIKELEEGLPPEEGEEERAGHGLFARVRPLILDGEDLDLPPALRKRKPDPS